MPNWSSNIVVIECTQDTKEKIKSALAGVVKAKDLNGNEVTEDLAFDFNRLVPMPDKIFRGNLGTEEREKYGTDNWYDWSCENWGTKWNACQVELDESIDDELCYRFDTAWDAPRPLVSKLRDMMKQYNANVDWSATHEFDDSTEEL